jgi:beta-phosphoglucomutase
MRPAGNIRGVVFDLDGVLMHSTASHRAAFEEVLRPFGVDDFDYSRYAGWRTPEVMAAEFRRRDVAAGPEIIREAAARKTLLARQKLMETNPVAGDCLEVLAHLAKSYRLALASSGSGGSVRSFLKLNGCESFFRSVLTGDDIVCAKPDPEIYSKSFAALELGPGDCVVIEDAVAGIEAARCAGAIAIGIAGTCSAETLVTAGAAHVVDSLSCLPDLLVTM